jgi:hypothetical protein
MPKLLCAALVLVAACGDDPVSVSDVVDIKLSLSSGDVAGDGTMVADKNINTESGNPYGAFVQFARDEIGGDAGRITVDGAAITVDATSSGITDLGEVFLGVTTVEFVMNGSSAIYPVATRAVVLDDGPGPVEFDVDLDSDDIPDEDFADLASGSFKVAISGTAADGFEAANADADMTVSLTFSAFE